MGGWGELQDRFEPYIIGVSVLKRPKYVSILQRVVIWPKFPVEKY